MEKVGKAKKVAREEKQREQKLEELVLKSLDECMTNEDKVKMLMQRQMESEKNVGRLTAELRVVQRHTEGQQREKEAMQRELNKCILMRDKLQEVCREQQRIIKSVKNESMLQIKVEEERRKESQIKFQSSLNDVQKSLSKNNEENIKLRDYNIEMTKKLKLLAEQYQTREQHLEKLNEQVKLESQLHQARLSKAQVEAAMEREILKKENQIGLEKLIQAQRSIKDLTDREHQLKEQLNIYMAKYDDFQQSLTKSNEVFGSYKIELEKMSKHTKKVEKESLAWRQRYEKANAMVIELATEKQMRDQQSDRLVKQVTQLQKLLRALQVERTTLHKSLRENKIEIPPLPQLPPEPEAITITPVNTDKAKMELMSRNCAELKQTLANLQNQMKLLTTAEAKTAIEEKNKAAEDQQKLANAKKNNKKKDKKSKAKAAAAAAAAPVAVDKSNEELTTVDAAAAETTSNGETPKDESEETAKEPLTSTEDQLLLKEALETVIELKEAGAGDASKVKNTKDAQEQTAPIPKVTGSPQTVGYGDGSPPAEPNDLAALPALIDAD
ncbi:alpha-taxilin [Drosophila guanche]|uniref:Blast:Alpha-taxilin n=1 Tax=Drosophila guanche TaxID=7266 RepID=A0A3B0KSJ2_DROGU|nr:alpha-taxilin [Drosophila guanche]SPP89699.1 blast:Alpha-taxilin [Drosophila guanche]